MTSYPWRRLTTTLPDSRSCTRTLSVRSRFRPRLSNVGIVSPTLDTRTLLCHRTRFNSSIDTCNDRIRRACAPASAHVPPPSTSRTCRGSVTDRSTQNHCWDFGNRLHPPVYAHAPHKPQPRSNEHTSELPSRSQLVCHLQ